MAKHGINWRSLLVAAGSLGGLAASAQVVQVPSGCVVVVPGVNGIAGAYPTGKVGDGGVVTMPDPFAAATFTFSGGTPVYWTGAGDISFATANTPPAAPNQSLGPVTSTTIQSYNKILRIPSENTLPSTSTMARSKGHVIVKYTNGSCGGFVNFDIFKKWSGYAPLIVGPNCFPSPAALITYSVDQVSSDNGLDAIGSDLYYWTLKNANGTGPDLFTQPGNTFYTSADRSSITINMLDPAFTTWYNNGNSGPYILACSYGRANTSLVFPQWDGGDGTTLAGNTHSVTVTKTIGAAAGAPTFTTPVPTCLPTNQSSFSVAYTSVVGNSYVWSCSNATWTLSSGTGTLNVSQTGSNPATLTLTVNSPCGINTYNYVVNRSLVGIALAAQYTCVAPNTAFNLQVPDDALGNVITWSGVTWTHNDFNAAHSKVTFIVPANQCAGVFRIYANSTSCPGGQIYVDINVKPTTPTISGLNCVPSGGGAAVTYTSTAPCGATSYTWSNNMGMTGTSSTSSIGYTPAGTANGNVYVIANGTNGCNSNQASLAVFRTPATPVVSIPYPCVNTGLPGTATFSVSSPQPSATYTWSFPAALGSPTAPTGSSVTINTTGTPGSYTCSVTASSGGSCTPVTSQFLITVGYNYGGFDFSTAQLQEPQGGTQSTISVPYVSGYQYQLYNCNTGVTGPVQNPSTGSFTLVGGSPGSFAIVITHTSPCGTHVMRTACVGTSHNLATQGNGGAPDSPSLSVNDGHDLRISPNPNDGSFRLDLQRDFRQGNVTLMDGQGRQMGARMQVTRGANALHFTDLAPGIYQVRIELDGHVETRSIVIAGQ